MARVELGNWFNVKNRYLGLRFQINGKTHYGWARVNVEVNEKHQLTATVTGYAYETIPNKAILAGQTGSDDALAPVPTKPQQSDPQNSTLKEARPQWTSLGALALGARGVPDRRNQ